MPYRPKKGNRKNSNKINNLRMRSQRPFSSTETKRVDENKTKDSVAPLSQIKILPFKEKNDWQLVSKYTIGKKKKEVL